MSKRKTKHEKHIESLVTARLTMLVGLLDWIRLRHAEFIAGASPEEMAKFGAEVDDTLHNWQPFAELPTATPGFYLYTDAERAAEVACGWAFDAGMREGHVWRLRNTLRLMEVVDAQHEEHALAADRARIAAAIRAHMHRTPPLQAYETLEDLLRVVEG